MQVWGIASQEPAEVVGRFVEQYGITYPVLLDEDGSVNGLYHQDVAFPSAAYPQDWVINSDGLIVYVNNGFELDAMVTVLEDDLSE